jgi:signal transduction histidine kinase
MMPLLKSLRGRLLLGTIASLAIMLFAAQVILSDLFEQHVRQRVEDELDEHLNFIGAKLDNALTAAQGLSAVEVLGEEIARLEPGYELPLSGYYWQVRISGQELRSRSLWDASLDLAGGHDDGSVAFVSSEGPDGEPLIAALRTITRSIVIDGQRHRTTAQLIATVPRGEITDALKAFRRDIDVYLMVLGLLLLLVGMIQIQIASHPLNRIRNAVAAIRKGDLARMPSGGPSELSGLVGEMNALLDALDQAVERARSRAADLAHGLKTPLAVIQGEMEHLRQASTVSAEQAEGIEQAIHQLDNHIRRELVRARVRGSAAGAVAKLEIRPHAERVVQLLSRLPQAGSLEFTIDIDEAATLAIDADDLTEILGNLLENAVRHARSRIAVSFVSGARHAILSIRDDGTGVAEADLGKLKQRGHRLDQQAHGTGLGLAIVEDIIEAYGGRLELESVQDQYFQARLIFTLSAGSP